MSNVVIVYCPDLCSLIPLQYLTIHDYLLRNFNLFRLESAYEIREDLADAISRCNPKWGFPDKTEFGGWARMALPVKEFK